MELKGQASTWVEGVRQYYDIRLLAIFVFGFASGYPWVIIGSSMTSWLDESGLTLSGIGFFGSIFGVYAINFLWSPLVDRVQLPVLHRVLGQRKSWILLMQVGMAAATFGLGSTDPADDLAWTTLLAFTIALLSATQDVAIDAYRIEVIPRSESGKISHGSAMTTAGWWTGYSLPGIIGFGLADSWGWDRVFLLYAAIWIPLMIAALLVREGRQRREVMDEAERAYTERLAGRAEPSFWQKTAAWIAVTLVEPLRDFWRRNGAKLAVMVLLFVFLFKLGEAFLGRMSIPFYKDVGFTDEQIGIYTKGWGWAATIIFSVFGSLVNARFGLVRGLVIGGVSMAASNLMFAWIALIGPNTHLYLATVIVDGFTSAFATVAFVAFISFLTSHAYTATQYALMASLGNLGRTVVGAWSGVLVEDVLNENWPLFFVITALMVIPSLVLLIWVARMLRERIRAWKAGEELLVEDDAADVPAGG